MTDQKPSKISYDTFKEAVTNLNFHASPTTYAAIAQLHVVNTYFMPLRSKSDHRKFHEFHLQKWKDLHARFCSWDRDAVLKQENRFINIHIAYHEAKLENL